MGKMHNSVRELLSAQFGPEFHARVVALSKCPQMISQHVRTMVHTGMDAGSVFLLAHANCTLFYAPNAQKKTGSQQGKKTIFLDVC